MPARLWAPWRAAYVEKPTSRRCIFCEIGDGASDRERLVLHRGRYAYVLLNRHPYSPGHVMVAPYRHAARFAELEEPARNELIDAVARCEQVLEEALSPHGLNVGANLGAAAGAGFEGHLHVHLVPRWKGDTNFMTTVGDVRVLPTDLERTWEQLAPRFAESGA